MVASRGLLNEIEEDLLSGKPLSDLLRKTIILGGRAGSAELRDWASRELKGFVGTSMEEMPEHRVIMAPLLADAVTGSSQVTGQPLPSGSLPDFAKEITEEFPVRQGVGELEAWVQKGKTVNIAVPGSEVIGAHIDRASGNPWQKIYSIYWAISPEVLAGVLDRIRTALAELIGELIVAEPTSGTPTPEQAAQAVNVAVHGSKARVTVTTAQSTQGGSAAVAPPQQAESGWWTRSRRIGAFIVGAATIIGAAAAVFVLF